MDSTADRVRSYLKKQLSPKRLCHTMGTVSFARKLAQRYGVSPDKAALAALLHDCSKPLETAEMIRYVKRYRVPVPEKKAVEKFNPSLFHSFISADMARRLFAVRDQEILEAIALHTVAAPAMATLAKIIYIADIAAPDRHFKGVTRIRRLSKNGLDAAFHAALAAKIAHVLASRAWLHPLSVQAWNSLLAPLHKKEPLKHPHGTI